MNYYARVIDGGVVELISATYTASGAEVPVLERFHPAIARTLVNVTGMQPMPVQGWTYDGSKFAPPGAVEAQ